MTTSRFLVLLLLSGFSLASPIGDIFDEDPPITHRYDESSDDTEVHQSYQIREEPSKMDQLFKAMMEMQDELLERQIDDKAAPVVTASQLEPEAEDSSESLEGPKHSLAPLVEAEKGKIEAGSEDDYNKEYGSSEIILSLAPMVQEDSDDNEEDDDDANQSRAGFNPFVKSVNATDDLIVMSPSVTHYEQSNTTDDEDEFSINLMNVIADDDHEDSKQETMLPFFPLFGAPILNSVVESLQRLQNQVQSMWSVYGNFNTSVLETLPNNYKNTTSMTKIVDGSLVQVNETVNKEVINGIPHLFHVKVVAVKPQQESQNTTSSTISDSDSSTHSGHMDISISTTAHAQTNNETAVV